MIMSLTQLHSNLAPIYAPLHRHIPFAPLDIYGAIRLSQIIHWINTSALDDPQLTSSARGDKRQRDAAVLIEKGPSALQECMGLMVVLFGGETFLGICTRTTPSWLISPKIGLLFALTHMIQTRTSLRRYIPSRPSLGMELALCIPDAIGRTLLLTQFSILPLLHPASPNSLPATPTTLILVPFILASPFAMLAFTGLNLFSTRPRISVPAELKPKGWMMVDAWLPVVIPAIYCTLIGPVSGWSIGLRWTAEEGTMVCLGVVMMAFLGRTVYNYGYRTDQWRTMLG